LNKKYHRNLYKYLNILMKKICFAVAALTLTLLSCATDKQIYKKYKHSKIRSKNSYAKNVLYAENVAGSKFANRNRANDISALNSPEDIHKFSSVRVQNKEKIAAKENNDDLQDIFPGDKYVGQYKIGQPYKIEDAMYYPQEYEYYEEVGVSSWYGDDFHGKATANGEVYNSGALTAAHQTLPLPSMVKVTNLDNGKNVIVRVNDRGPFAKSRIIDVSEAAADKLGFKGRGTATVKVEFLEKETDDLLKTLNVRKND